MKTILVDAVNTLIIQGVGVDTQLHTLLETYKNPKIILTNANDEQTIAFGLVNLPYDLFTLKHNPDKVDPSYFEQMLKHFNLVAEDVIYFEHNDKAVESARSVGILSYHFDHEKRDLKALQNFLDTNI